MLRQLRRREEGQTMAEFAIILPMLLLLTIGTIELGVFLQRQIILSGAGFLAARAATVGGKEGNNPSLAAQEVMRAYSEDSKQPWIGKVVSGSEGKLDVKTEAADRAIRVQVTKKETSLGDLLAAFGGGGSQGKGQIGASIAVNREFVQGRGSKSAAQYPANGIVNYPLAIENPAIAGTLAGIAQAANQIQALPFLPDAAKGLLTLFTFSPLQAVLDNPGRDERYRVGRTEAAVYTSSDLETAPGDAAYLRPSERLYNGLKLAPAGLRTLQALSKTAQEPMLKASLVAMQKGAVAAANMAESMVIVPVRGAEMSLFTTTGDLK